MKILDSLDRFNEFMNTRAGNLLMAGVVLIGLALGISHNLGA